MVSTKKKSTVSNQPSFFSKRNVPYILLSVILLITFIVYAQVGSFSFLNWDDDKQITDNVYIKSLDKSTFENLFRFDKHTSLSLMTFALEYKLVGLNPAVFHYSNLFLHLINILLIFFLARKMLDEDHKLALLVTALFALHPLRVESIAWVSERKDLLYTFFFFSSMLCYIRYVNKKSIVLLILSVILGYLSSISKIQALTLPIVWFLIDLYYKRKFSINYIFEKYWLVYLMLLFNPVILKDWFIFLLFSFSYAGIFLFEKSIVENKYYPSRIWAFISIVCLFSLEKSIPHSSPEFYFILSIAVIYIYHFLTPNYKRLKFKQFLSFYHNSKKEIWTILGVGLLAVFVAVSFSNFFGFWNFQDSPESRLGLTGRLIFASYSLVFYLVNFLIPHNFNAIHPYPMVENIGALPISYFVATALMLIIWVVFIYLIVFRKYRMDRLILFGLLFFLSNIVLVLHIIPIEGRLLVADRYSYLAYSGLFIAVAAFWKQKQWIRKKIAVSVAIVVLIVYALISYNRSSVWENSISLFKDVVTKDANIGFAWLNLGTSLMDKGDLKKAIDSYNQGLKGKNASLDISMLYNSRGWAYYCMQPPDTVSARKDFDKAVEVYPLNHSAFNNRGWMYYKQGNYPHALTDFSKAIALDSMNFLYFNNRGMLYNDLKSYDEAIIDFSRCLSLNPDYYFAFNNRGWAYLCKNDLENAIINFSVCLDINPDYSTARLNRGNAYFLKGEYRNALADYENADYNHIPVDYNLLHKIAITNLKAGKTDKCCCIYKEILNAIPTFRDSLLEHKCIQK